MKKKRTTKKTRRTAKRPANRLNKRHLRKRFRKKKSFLKNKIFWYVVLILLGLSGLVYFLFFSAVFRIEEAQVITPLSSLPAPAIKQLAEEELEQSRLFFFKGSNYFLVDKAAIEEIVLKSFPELSAVKLKRRLPNQLILEPQKREPAASWCYQKTKQCYLIDRAGVLFAEVESAPAIPDLMEVVSSQDLQGELLSEAISPEKLSQLFLINKTLVDNLEIGLERFETDGQNGLLVKTQEGWKIYFALTTEQALELTLTKLSLLLEQELTSEKRKNLEYVDLRFSKVYYK